MSTPILTIDQLIVPLTPLQMKTKIYEFLAMLNVSTTNWKPGGVVRLMISAASIVLAGLSLMISLIAKSAFAALSEGPWLTLVARFVYGVERGIGSFASGSITLTNTAGGSFDPAADEIIFSNPVTGKTYRNTAPFHLGSNSSVTIAIRADEIGSASSTGPGTITHIVTSMIGVTCSNAGTLIGTDEQSDASLFADCMLKPQSLSPNGPREAYKFFAKNTVRLDGTAVGINRVVVSNSSTTGQSIVTVATPAGAVAGTQSDPATDLGATFANIAQNALPECATLTVRSAVTRVIDVRFWAYFPGSMVVPASVQEATAAPVIEAWISSEDSPIGGVTIPGVCSNQFLRDTLRDVIAGAFKVRPTLVVISYPPADITLGATEVPEPGTIAAVAA